MSDERPMRPTGSASFWQTVPGILTAVAAVLTAVATLIGALGANGLLRPHEPAPPNVAPDAAHPTQLPDQSDNASGATGCVTAALQPWPNAHVTDVELGRNQWRTPLARRTVALRLVEDGRLLGLVVVNARQDGSFRMLATFDAACRPVTTFSNPSGAGQGFMENWDSLRGVLGAASYELRLGQVGNDLEINRFTRLMP